MPQTKTRPVPKPAGLAKEEKDTLLRRLKSADQKMVSSYQTYQQAKQERDALLARLLRDVEPETLQEYLG